MVTIKSHKEVKNEEGQPFNMLILQGNVEPVRSKESGKWYITARKTGIPSTFERETCESLIGKTLPGTIERVPCDPYEFVTDSGEKIILEHTYEYNPEPVSMSTEEHVFNGQQEGLGV